MSGNFMDAKKKRKARATITSKLKFMSFALMYDFEELEVVQAMILRFAKYKRSKNSRDIIFYEGESDLPLNHNTSKNLGWLKLQEEPENVVLRDVGVKVRNDLFFLLDEE
jgi:hypothetical protein|tara:strand:- start:315 stop:644 length:330 start_codon:yes stop_codon:yes gene_type:complete